MSYSDEVIEAVAQVIALWDYRTNTGEEPEEGEDIVLPPHLQAAVEVLGAIESFESRDA